MRRALQKEYGDGGPGFVHAGWAKYRHEKAQTRVGGKWKTEPGDYARLKRYDDGVLGLGGVRHVPRDPGATAELEVRGASGEASFRWDVAYRLPEDAGLSVAFGEGPEQDLPGAGAEGVRHHTPSVAPGSKVRLRATRGRPQLFGVVIEARTPGLVLDTVGLNGARVGTFLAWEPAPWIQEVTRRKPDLVVLAFGTNESSDVTPEAARYEQAAAQLLGRLRQGAPGADCLVITPMDRAGPGFAARLAIIAQGLTAAATAAGCAVWSAMDAMDGPGGMERWAAESPARGGADGIHLTARGYGSLGEMLARDLIHGAERKAGLPLRGKAP